MGLDYLHSKLHIIHTDLKPENVVVASAQKAVQKAMFSYTAPADRYRQISLIERDRTTLSKAQKKRLRKKLKMQKREGLQVPESTCIVHGDDSGTCGPAENGTTILAQQQVCCGWGMIISVCALLVIICICARDVFWKHLILPPHPPPSQTCSPQSSPIPTSRNALDSSCATR